MVSRSALILLFFVACSCVVRSPAPYRGDVAAGDVPLRPGFDPEAASYRQPPILIPAGTEVPQRQTERADPTELDRQNNQYDYYYIHTPEGSILQRKVMDSR